MPLQGRVAAARAGARAEEEDGPLKTMQYGPDSDTASENTSLSDHFTIAALIPLVQNLFWVLFVFVPSSSSVQMSNQDQQPCSVL